MLLFRNRLKETRMKLGLTQQELGNLAGVTKVSICCYEKGTRTPTLDTLLSLANVLNVDFTYLLGDDQYVVADDDESYGMNLAKEELIFIQSLRKHHALYKKILSEPERLVKTIEKKVK